MLKRFAFFRKMLYICIAKRRRPVNTGLSPLFGSKTTVSFSQRPKKFSLRAENFSPRAVNFSLQLERARAFPVIFSVLQS